jgi:hypothetical protein
MLQFFELCGRQQPVSGLVALSVIVESPLDVSPDGVGTTWPWHLQDQVGILRDCHELGECRPSQESVVHSFKLYVLCAKVFLSAEGQGKEDLADGCCCCPMGLCHEREPD